MTVTIGRRELLTALGGAAAAWPLAAGAQQSVTKMPRIGIIGEAAIWDHFRKGLRDFGYIEGRNVTIEYRSVEERPDQLAAAARELARLPVDVFVTYGSPATQAAKQATTTIPIVMNGVGDAIRAGFVTSLAHPEGYHRHFAPGPRGWGQAAAASQTGRSYNIARS